MRSATTSLRIVKAVHTAIWAFFAGCIIAIPFLALRGRFTAVAVVIGVVMVEVFVLLANRWQCPLTGIAERFTRERRDNFDIYLPEWLARHNKAIFGSLFIAGLVFSAVRWLLSHP
jgi:hypothetical protein